MDKSESEILEEWDLVSSVYVSLMLIYSNCATDQVKKHPLSYFISILLKRGGSKGGGSKVPSSC